MKLMLVSVLIALAAAPALADKPVVEEVDASQRVGCDLLSECWVWEHAFTVESCGAGGVPVWEHGPATGIPATDCNGDPIEAVLGTVVDGDYPNDAGERAIVSDPFIVDGVCNLLEICHYYDIENMFDGGNVEVGVDGAWTVVEPIGGYPEDLISDSDVYHAWCVDLEPGFSDGPTDGFVRDCFDLMPWIGQEIQIALKFGSDSSVTYPGWYICDIRAGSLVTPSDAKTWSTFKSLY